MSAAEIQRARDVLAKWRSHTDNTPWSATVYTVHTEADAQVLDYSGVLNLDEKRAALANVKLIVGTAGNPDLLDAIDEVLDRGAYEVEDSSTNGSFVARRARRIAAAIIAADERMGR